MNLARFLLDKTGWRFTVNIPDTPKCLICVAPHTSNWDFIVGELGIHAAGMKSGFLMKSAWFFFPLGCILRSMGGIAVHRGKQKGHHSSVTDIVVEEFNNRDALAIAVTPEGTRSPNANWHHGIIYMAQAAHVPIVLAYIDYRSKEACLDKVFSPTGDLNADMASIRSYYQDKQEMARFPEKFETGI